MAECNHDCTNCEKNCGERTDHKSFIQAPRSDTHIKKIIAVVSGKGGVGKSLVTCLLASKMNHSGRSVAILDADITGPSIPYAFGVHELAMGNGDAILPNVTPEGIKMMSLNLMVQNETDPVVWRGPIIADTVKQFWTDVQWGDVDYMFVDMPPGTGDVPLTVFQSIPVDGIIVVTSPQELVSMIVKKAINMAKLMNIPVLGLVENYSYAKCPNCGEKLHIFGESHVEELAKEYNVLLTDAIPIDRGLASACDSGCIASFETEYLDNLVNKL